MKVNGKNTAKDNEEANILRNRMREMLGEDAEEQEGLILELSLDELHEMLGMVEEASGNLEPPDKNINSMHGDDAVAPPVFKTTPDPSSFASKKVTDTAANASLTGVAARAGIGARAFTKNNQSPDIELKLDDDDSDFEGVHPKARLLVQKEYAEFCKRCPLMREYAVLAPESKTNLEEKKADVIETQTPTRYAEPEQPPASAEEELVRYFEELELKSELHFKTKLHGLTPVETAELFEQHGFDAPKDGDFEKVTKNITQIRAQLSQIGGGLRKTGKSRYLDGELVETKDKYFIQKKESHEAIRATTVNISLMGNSSKARRDHRKGDEEKKRGPVSNLKQAKKK